MSLCGHAEDCLDELVVVHPGRSCSLWKTGIVFGIGKNARQWIQLKNMWDAVPIQSHIDSAPILAAKDGVCPTADCFDRMLEVG